MSTEARCSEWAENCARPVMFANESEDYPYSHGGTCFLFGFQGRRYLATAAHVMAERKGEELQVHADRGYTDTSIPLDGQLTVAVEADLLEVAKDVAVFRLAESKATEAQRAACDAFQLEQWLPCRLKPRDPQLVVGYPLERRKINYDERHFTHQRVIAEASYSEDSANLTHWMTLDIEVLHDPNGFSGSPVFSIDWSSGHCRVKWFSGIVISSTAKHPWDTQFVCASVLKAMVEADNRETVT